MRLVRLLSFAVLFTPMLCVARAEADPLRSASDSQVDDLFTFLRSEVVWAATKTTQSADEAPATVTVIRAEDIRRWGYMSVAELLQHTVGFYMVNDYLLPNAGVRGVAGGLASESGNIKVMIDGHPVAFRTTGGSWLGPELVPLSSVERIEIVRGPASALYGADAFLAVINVVTISGKDLDGALLSAGYTVNALGHTGYDVDGIVGMRIHRFELSASARVCADDDSGQGLPDASPNPTVPSYREAQLQAQNQTALSLVTTARLDYTWEHKLRVSVMGQYQHIDRGGEFSSWTQMSYGYDPNGRLNETRISLYQATVAAKVEATPSDALTLNLSGRLFTGGPNDDDRIEVGSDAFFVRRDFGYLGGGALGEVRWKMLAPMTAVAGVEFEWDRQDLLSRLNVLKLDAANAHAGEVDESASTSQGSDALWNVGSFAQLLWTVHERYLRLTGGYRFDRHVLYGNQHSGRAAAVSEPLKDLVIKLLYGSSFKAPPPLLLYAIPLLPGDIKGTQTLDPQFIHTYEALLSYRALSVLKVTTGLAYSHLTDKAEFIQQGVHRVAQNIAQMDALSWTLEMRASDSQWVEGYASIEWTTARREIGLVEYQQKVANLGNPIYPPWIIRAGVSGRLPWLPLVSASLQALYASPRAASDMNVLEAGRPYDLDGYLLLNATISAKLELLPDKPSTIRLIGRNLLKSNAADPGFAGVEYPITPLTVMLQLEQRL